MVIVMSAIRIGVIRMKNKEKHSKEITDIACNGNSIAVVRSTGELRPCCEISCGECLFNASTSPCREEIRKWAESEYVERQVISKRDRAFLEYIREEYKFVARDENGNLFVYSSKPCKDKRFMCWCSCGCSNSPGLYLNYNVDFPMVKWSDDKPWLIEGLKKLEVVENYE